MLTADQGWGASSGEESEAGESRETVSMGAASAGEELSPCNAAFRARDFCSKRSYSPSTAWLLRFHLAAASSISRAASPPQQTNSGIQSDTLSHISGSGAEPG